MPRPGGKPQQRRRLNSYCTWGILPVLCDRSTHGFLAALLQNCASQGMLGGPLGHRGDATQFSPALRDESLREEYWGLANLERLSSGTSTSVTLGSPSVSVPVLSRQTESMVASCSRCTPPLTIAPYAARQGRDY